MDVSEVVPDWGKAEALGSQSVQSICMPALQNVKNHSPSSPPSLHIHKQWDQSPIKPQKKHLSTSHTHTTHMWLKNLTHSIYTLRQNKINKDEKKPEEESMTVKR